MALDSRIDSLKSRHTELEAIIATKASRPHPDDTEIHALKKEKLRIKDELVDLTRH
ncbi:MAG: YdcH family protein [Magnetovibrio sp.]|nr:YdcH family protein [Magnetovibrio sp.]